MSAMQTAAYPWTLALIDVISAVLYLFIGLNVLVLIKRIVHWRTYLPAPDQDVKQPKHLQDLDARLKDLKKNA